MMQSILSLIHESLTNTTTSSDSSENASSPEAPKSGTRGEFESILTREDPQAMRASATRIKARATSTDEMNDDESDEDDATTCVNVDDFAAWAIQHTLIAPPPSPSMLAMAKHPSLEMNAVKLPSSATLRAANSDFRNLRNINTTYASPAPMPLPALDDRAGETIPAAALAPKTQEFAAPITQEIAAVKDDAPNSSAITREIPIPTATPKTQEMAAVQTSSFIEKMARSKNATDIPPPSGIPMVSGFPSAPTRAPNASMQPRQDDRASNDNSSNNPKPRATKAWDSKVSSIATRVASTNAPVLSEAAFRPTVTLAATDPRNMISTTPTRLIEATDLQEASDARQAAATKAVNQLTLSRAADGEMDIPELGRVRVDATTKNGEVDVRITADRQQTQELVASHTHEIVIDAHSAAIPIVDLRVKWDPRAEPPMNFSSSQESPKRRDPRSENDESSEKQAHPARGNSRARFVL